MLHEGLTTGQAAKYISRHPKTLQAMDRAGVLPARRTASGRRYWLQPDLDRYRYDLGANTDACEIKRYFNSFKYEAFPWLQNIHRAAHAQPFAALGKAWKAYFNGEVEGRPQFKKKGKCRDCFYVACDKFSSNGKTVRLPVLGQVQLREPLRFTGKIQSATVSREADRWFIAMAVEIPQKEVHPPSGEALGIDLGLTTFAVLSNGRKVEAPKPLGRGLERLRRLSRAHSRKRRGSHNRQKAALRLARCHRRIANMRRDFLHKFTTKISKNHAEIFVENLNVQVKPAWSNQELCRG